MNIYNERIERLRKEMAAEGIDVYYIPMSDWHNSEYVAGNFRCIEFISGFTGSAGSVVITSDNAWLFADGRYYIQAENQINGSGIALMKIGQRDVPELFDFLIDIASGKTLGFDGSVVTADFGKRLENSGQLKGIIFDKDLIDRVWIDRPEQTFSDIYELDIKFTGEEANKKLDRIRNELEKNTEAGNDYLYIINSLDDIAWIFNLRADDIPNNPVFYSYAAITKKEVRLFTGSKAPEGIFIQDKYSKGCLNIEGYKKIFLDEKRISYDTFRFYKDRKAEIINIENPSTLMKAIKNKTEIKCLKEALVKDSVVIIRFMKWLKENIGILHIDEVSAAEHLQEMRMQQEGYIELSFETISAYKENAAQMHYAPQKDNCKKLMPEGFLLVDSGCQYYEGTTDITRTFALGPLTQEEKKAFTLTAVSMLRLLNAKFIKGCSGENLDIIAREPMWKEGWDYKCGTGHGVGHVLSVHEGPHNIRWKINHAAPTAILEPGMVVTDEPGVYREGEFGIRTENELLVTDYMETPDGEFLQFENLTFIPIDLDAIDRQYMTQEDIGLLNAYHKSVYDKTAGLLSSEEKDWLKKYTREI